ncbi:MAG: F0F1 ATP synthase subunit epsilon [Gammaproteobacteria bacterium RIFCSPHIGHO2_12_FULL_41_20]|nr:MAG: F0F1 ATP synthase subunit epsilon [Gammaproteobacteria bacterium RIFCSPHIGHO2_12_FULL_41_20]
MTSMTLRLDIVSAEKQIFSGEVEMVHATGELGEMGIAPGHSPLLTSLQPGHIYVMLPNKEEEVFYVSGGMLEVQPFIVSVLADTAARAKDLDEAKAFAAKEHAQKVLSEKGVDIDFAKAAIELAEAAAQIRAIQRLKKRAK